MNILYCNNYCSDLETINRVDNMLYPKSHLWGIYNLYKQQDHHIELAQCPNMNSIKSRIIRLLSTFCFQIRLFLQYRKYDVVYAACAHQIDIFAFFKKIKLFKGRLYVVIHHPGRHPFLSSYNKIFFISNFTLNFFIKKYKITNGEFIFWGPDLDFYNAHKNLNESKKFDIYSNGKTLRDYSILYEYAKKYLNRKILIVGTNSNNMQNISCQFRVSDIENIAYCCTSKVMVIPIIKTSSTIVGLTSINDALGVGLPMLIADTANLGIDIEKYGLGLEYTSENYGDFERKVEQLLNNYTKYGEGIHNFTQKFNYKTFEQKIEKELIEG